MKISYRVNICLHLVILATSAPYNLREFRYTTLPYHRFYVKIHEGVKPNNLQITRLESKKKNYWR